MSIAFPSSHHQREKDDQIARIFADRRLLTKPTDARRVRCEDRHLAAPLLVSLSATFLFFFFYTHLAELVGSPSHAVCVNRVLSAIGAFRLLARLLNDASLND